MRKALSLSDGTFVVDRPNPTHQELVEGYFSQRNALLLRLLRFVSALEAQLFSPPMVKSRNWQGGEVVPFPPVGVLRRGISYPLYKREQINPRSAAAQAIHYGGWLVLAEKTVLVSFNSGHPHQPTVDPDISSVNPQHCILKVWAIDFCQF